jgi:2'-5' RNA ligase
MTSRPTRPTKTASIRVAFDHFGSRTADAKDGKKTGEGTSVGLFMPLPAELTKQFPRTRGTDKSVPHVTFLYIGEVAPEQEPTVVDIINRNLSKLGPVRATLSGLEYFINQHGQKIAHVEVSFNVDMAAVRRKVRRELMDAGVDVQDSFQQYCPHSTLAYLDDLDAEWLGPVPTGQWDVGFIELWGASKLHQIPLGTPASERVRALAASLKRADLYPALGLPSEAGVCYVMDRVKSEVRNQKLREELIGDLEEGEFDSKGEQAVYDAMVEHGPGKAQMVLVEHVQRRMDERGITVPEIRLSLQHFMKWLNDEKSRKTPAAREHEERLAWGRRIVWTDKKLGLEIAFAYQNKRFVVITAYWLGDSDPKIPPGGCESRSQS